MPKNKIPTTIGGWVWFYYTQGFGVIPIREHDKKPNIADWKQYTTKRADKETVQSWLDKELFKNIGVQCGLASAGLCVIDIDNEKIVDDLKLKLSSIINSGCWISSTGKGFHIWTINIEEPGNTILDGDIHADFKTTGYIVVPPSLHPSGRQYKFINKTFKSLKPMTSRKMYNEMNKKLREIYDIKNISKDDIIPKENIVASCIANLLDGVAEGTRDAAAFALTQFYFKIKKIDKEAVYAVMREWNQKNRPPLPSEEIDKCIKQGIECTGKTGCNKMRSMKKCPFTETKECSFLYPNRNYDDSKSVLDLSNPPSALQDVYTRLQKWLFIDDTYRIDLSLACIMSNAFKDAKPLWMFIIGQSGDGKSEILMGFKSYPDVIVLDRITANTLATGKTHKGKKLPDLGEELQNSSHIIIFSDLACLKSVRKDDKDEIWGQLRELYDERINKRTGNNTLALYDNCHVTLIACSTPDIRDEYSIHNQLGTRELCYEIEGKEESVDEKMLRAISHLGYETEMKKDIAEALQGFIKSRTFNKDIKPNEELLRWIMAKCKELAIMRASGRWERQTGELAGDVTCEVPTRLIQQFMLLYKSLMSIHSDYPVTRFKHIVENIVQASGDVMRQKIFLFFKKYPDGEFNLDMLHDKLGLGRRTLKRQCELLAAMGVLHRTFKEEYYGANNNLERRVRYYSMSSKKIGQLELAWGDD